MEVFFIKQSEFLSYTKKMDSKSHLKYINVKIAAKEARHWSGALQHPVDASMIAEYFSRLAMETHNRQQIDSVRWSATFSSRVDTLDQTQIWLHLTVNAVVPLTCQRCLEAVLCTINVDRWFRFEKDENSAAAQDEFSEEDVLVIDQEFNLIELIEDELLMAIPMIPLHETCPEFIKVEAKDIEFDSQSDSKPFAILSELTKFSR